jgi:hypothetical protein
MGISNSPTSLNATIGPTRRVQLDYDVPANPLRESLICLEAHELQPVGTLARTQQAWWREITLKSHQSRYKPRHAISRSARISDSPGGSGATDEDIYHGRPKVRTLGDHHVVSPLQSDGRAQSCRPAAVASPPAEEPRTAQQRSWCGTWGAFPTHDTAQGIRS